jgi:hypothetical protein
MSQTTTQEHLDRFYIELQAWIDGGCKRHRTFSIDYGICATLIDWAFAARLGDRVALDLRNTLAGSFGAANLCPAYPFYAMNGEDEYPAEKLAGAVYRNPARLAWIKARADEAKARQAVAA